MTNPCSCLEVPALWKWGILSETNSIVHHPFCSPLQTVPWLLFPRAVHWRVCPVGRVLCMAVRPPHLWHSSPSPWTLWVLTGATGGTEIRRREGKEVFSDVMCLYRSAAPWWRRPMNSFLLRRKQARKQPRSQQIFPSAFPSLPSFYRGLCGQPACVEWLKCVFWSPPTHASFTAVLGAGYWPLCNYIFLACSDTRGRGNVP